MPTIDEQFIEYIVRSLVEHGEDVSIERQVDEKGVLLSLTVHPDDLGRVIGKRGATAQSLRTLLRALGTKHDARYNLKIINTDEATSSDDESREDVESTTTETVENDGVKKHRKDLADLDDLDI